MAPSNLRRRVTIGAIWVVVATTLSGIVAVAPADAGPHPVAASVAAVGSVSGAMTAFDGSAPAGYVMVVNLSGAVVGSQFVNTPGGVYTIGQLPPGTYHLFFSGQRYAEQWYGGSAFPAESTPIQLSAGQNLTGVDAVLGQQATIGGNATYYSQRYYYSYTAYKKTVQVTVWAKDPVSGQSVTMGGAAPDSSGTYTVTGLPAGTYTVQFSSQPYGMETRFPFVSQYWNGAATRAGATPVTLTTGQAVTGVDAALQDASPPRILHDYSGDGHPDLLAVNGAGGLYSYMTNGLGGWNSPTVAQVGSGWNGMRLVTAVGDFDGDGHPDLMGLDPSGRLWLYPGNGHNGWLPRRLVATGWQGMTAVIDFGDFYGYGTNDLMARDASGTLWLYRGNGSGGLESNPRAVGSGWNAMTTIIGGTDFNYDGFPDLVARDAAGVLWVYPEQNGVWGYTDQSGLLGSRFAIGSGWNAMTSIVSVGTVTADDTESVLARDSSGALWLYSYNATAKTWAPRRQIGSGWNGMTWIG